MPNEKPSSKKNSKNIQNKGTDTQPTSEKPPLETTSQSQEKESETKPKIILEELSISSISFSKKILELDEKQKVSLAIDYSANEDCQINCQILGSKNCLFDYPKKITLSSKKEKLVLSGELAAQKAGESKITIELTYENHKTSSSFEIIVLPRVSLTFQDIPQKMIPVKKEINLSLSCQIQRNGGTRLPLKLTLIDGRRVVDTKILSQPESSAIHQLTYQAKSPGFKTLKAKIAFQKKVLAKTKASEDILIYSPQDLPGELMHPEIFIGKKPQFDLLYLVADEKKSHYEQMRKVVKTSKKICYLAFSFVKTSQDQWPDIKDFFLTKSNAPILLLFSLLPIEQRLIIIPVDNYYEEFKIKKTCQLLNNKLAKKIKGEFVTQKGLLAKGAFKEFFVSTEPKDKQVIPIITSVGFLDTPKLLAKALRELVNECQSFSTNI